MTPKEKAQELYSKFRGFNNETPEINKTTAIQCALIVVDQIIEENKNCEKLGAWPSKIAYRELYWYEVKTEIESK